MTQKPTGQASTPLAELQALRREFVKVREELEGLRADLKSRKLPNISNEVAIGVVIAGVFWFVLFNFLQVLGQILGIR